MIRVALLSLLLVARYVDAADIPRPDLEGALPPIVDRITTAAAAVEASSGSADAWGGYAMVLHANHFTPESDRAYAEAHRLAPAEFRWVYFRGVLWQDSKPSWALKYIDRAIRLDAEYGPAFIRRGLILESLGRDDDAWWAYRAAIRLEPSNLSAHVHLGQLELKRNDLEAAVQHLEKALAGRPDDAAVLSALARAYARQGDRTRAREMAEAARRTEEGRLVDDRRFNEVAKLEVTLRAFIARAEVYHKAGRYDEALRELLEALEFGHDPGPVHGTLARLYLKRREFEACVESGRKALAHGEDDAELHLVLGAGLFQLARFAEAEEAVRNALDRGPGDRQARRLYGRIAAARGRHDEAVAELEGLLSTSTDDTETWFALGEVHRAAGDLDAALTAFDRAAEHASAPLAGRRAVLVLLDQRRYADAEARLRALLARWPNSPNLINDLAWLLATCPDDAVRDGAEALALVRPLVRQTRRKQPAVLDTLAAALAESGRLEDAVRIMDEVLALLPADTPADRRTAYAARRERYASGRAWRDVS
jgi:tetratricopeptide (TPR) repeat protein